jgi:hypothetical protein
MKTSGRALSYATTFCTTVDSLAGGTIDAFFALSRCTVFLEVASFTFFAGFLEGDLARSVDFEFLSSVRCRASCETCFPFGVTAYCVTYLKPISFGWGSIIPSWISW